MESSLQSPPLRAPPPSPSSPGSYYPPINPSITIVGFALSSAFILCVCLRAICLWAVHYRSNSDALSGRTIATENNQNLTSEGLNEETIDSLPLFQFDPTSLANKEDSSCSVCLEDYSNKDLVRKLPVCGHSFHKDCINPWLRSHKTCPYCRASVEASSSV